MRRASILAILAVATALAACGPGNKQGTGTIVGAVAGGAAGAAIAGSKNRAGGIAIGAVVGGLIGNQVGRSMDEEDRRLALAAEYQALEYGQAGAATPWDNPQTQNRGQIGRASHQQRGPILPAYTYTIYIGGRRRRRAARPRHRRHLATWAKGLGLFHSAEGLACHSGLRRCLRLLPSRLPSLNSVPAGAVAPVLVWFILALLTAIVLFVLLRPLAARRGPVVESFDAAVYRDNSRNRAIARGRSARRS
jgi:surface antigen